MSKNIKATRLHRLYQVVFWLLIAFLILLLPLSLLVNLAIVAIALCNAERFARWMGTQGLRGVSKIIALLLAAIVISLIRRGWQMT